MKTLKQVQVPKGTPVVLRADFNVPLSNGKITDTYRIIKTIPTIQKLLQKKVRLVIISHSGDDGSQSLKPVFSILKKYIPVQFVGAVFGVRVEEALANIQPGEALLLENLRIEPGEKKNTLNFARALASYGEVYVNDAFSVSHRPHASIVGIPKFLPAYAGLQLEAEVRHLSQVLKPKHPFLFILGGNKFSTKMPLIKKFEGAADTIFIGGALLNNLLLAKGYEIGKSVYESGYNVQAVLKNKKLLLPIDLIVTNGKKTRTCAPYEVQKNEMIMDIGPQTITLLIQKGMQAKQVLWNGPIGYYDRGFAEGSKRLLKGLAKSRAEVVIGGGDTVALVSKMKLTDSFTFVSTGGGATLDFLAHGTLPGIKALK